MGMDLTRNQDKRRMSQDYESKDLGYFSHARDQIEPLLDVFAERALEIGCGTGATLGWLKSVGRVKETFGIELSASAGERAALHLNGVLVGDAELLIDTAYPNQLFDLVLCLDVLEHMVDPWRFVEKLHRLVSPAGRVVFSIPNVRSLSVVLPLMFLGRWRYRDLGILDRTHLRFFTREGAIDLATTSEFEVRKWRRIIPSRDTKMGLLNSLTLGLFPDLMARQYLILSARRSCTDR